MLEKLRKERSLSQEQLAEILNVSRPTITRAENGVISVKTAKKAAAFFGVDWKKFFDDNRTKTVRKNNVA